MMRIVQAGPSRILIGAAWLLLVSSLAQLAIASLLGDDTLFMRLIGLAIFALAMIQAYDLFVTLIEKRRVSELSLPKAGIELGAGILAGVGLFSAVMGVLALLGYYKVDGTNDWMILWSTFSLAVVSGVLEELLFRGILFRIMEESLGTWISLGVTALIFGLLHMMNPNASLFAGLAIALEAGILLAAVYMLTRRLWLAIGLHFAWNFVQGGIFGVAVSGYERSGLLRGSLTGPELLTGGAFGAEASVVAIVICLAAAVLVLRAAYQKGRFIPPFWMRKQPIPTPTAPVSEDLENS